MWARARCAHTRLAADDLKCVITGSCSDIRSPWLPQNIAEMSPSDEFVAILVPQLGRLGLPALFDRLLLVVRIALTRRRNQAGIDELTRHGDVTSLPQHGIELLE